MQANVIVPSGDVSPTRTSDVGSKLYQQYSDELRKEIGSMAVDLGLKSLLEGHDDGLLSAFPVVQSEQHRLLVNLANYDIDHDRDAIRPKQNVSLSIPAPKFLPDTLRAVLYQGQDHEIQLDANNADGMITSTIPEIQGTAVLVVTDHE
jgi:hypothetical protein